MKQLLKFGLICTIATSGLMFTACEGEDGDPGAAGAKGDKGDKGDTGEEGVGFDEATKLGNISVRFKGTRADNVAFDKTIDFKFSPTGPETAEYSFASTFNNEGSSGTRFGVARTDAAVVAPFGDESDNAMFGLVLQKYDNAETEFSTEVYTRVMITSSDMKYFTLNFSGYTFPGSTVSGFSFTSATGELKYTFTGTLPEDNTTNHPIEITATVNAKVFQDLDVD